MRYLSLCSGIEAASVAWAPLGWQPAAFAEIEAFPSAVLKAHYPSTPNLGDITKFEEWPDLGTVDLVCGGTPCQSFSVAGLRAGLADPRGNLMLTFLAIAGRYRPRWILWENVPGVLSSDGGRDFGTFLSGLGQLGYGWAYRVLDAQFTRVDGFPRAVPQRRRRVFVVGCLGDWASAAAVLSERQSLLGDSPPRRTAGENTSSFAVSSIGGYRDTEVSGILRAEGGDYGGGSENLVAPTLPWHGKGGGFGSDFDCDGGLIPSISNALAARDAKQPRAEDNVGLIAVPVAGSLACNTGPNGNDAGNPQAVQQAFAVRRLTPVECERLMGFPDGYTDVPYRGKPAADGPRYRALGNSWAVNCVRWIGRRINMVEKLSVELARREAAE